MHINNNLPVIAWLKSNNNVIAVNKNEITSQDSFIAHAEMLCIKQIQKNHRSLELFTTLEPCGMCLFSAIHSRIKAITFYCRDPIAGSSHIEPPSEWYSKNWPRLIYDNSKECAILDLLIDYMSNSSRWRKHASKFIELRNSQ